MEFVKNPFFAGASRQIWYSGATPTQSTKLVLQSSEVCLLFNVAVVFFFCNVFPFPICKAQLIGDWYEYRRGAPNCSLRLFLKLFGFGPPIDDVKLVEHC